MGRYKEIGGELAALVLLSAGGLLMHLRIHPLPSAEIPANPANIIPFVFGILGIVVVPLLLCFERTWLTGYLINGFGVVIGSVLMAYLSISSMKSFPGLAGLLTGTTLSVILLALPKLMIAQRIMLHYRPLGFGRMFTPLWWTRHFIYVSAVFIAGRLLGG